MWLYNVIYKTTPGLSLTWKSNAQQVSFDLGFDFHIFISCPFFVFIFSSKGHLQQIVPEASSKLIL